MTTQRRDGWFVWNVDIMIHPDAVAEGVCLDTDRQVRDLLAKAFPYCRMSHLDAEIMDSPDGEEINALLYEERDEPGFAPHPPTTPTFCSICRTDHGLEKQHERE